MRHHCTFHGCLYETKYKTHFTVHVRTHTGEKPYVCTEDGCGAAFAKSSDLTRHIRTHTGEKPFACLEAGCGRAFADGSSLTKHIRTHTREKPYTCTEAGCGKAFAESGNLTVHMRTHSGEKPYACTAPGCGKAFAESGHLTVHMRTHSGEKPYACTESGCGRAFAERGSLTKHMRTHSGEKPYACTKDGCGKAFAVRCALLAHMRTHSGEKPYACTECISSFTQSGNFKRHMSNYHTLEGQQKKKKKEEKLAKFLTDNQYPFQREHRIEFQCMGGTYCRVDFLLQMHTHTRQQFIVCLENDEGAHKDRPTSCEIKRMMDVSTACMLEGNSIPIVWIRFNCDTFCIDDTIQKVNMNDRYKHLQRLIQTLESTTSFNPLTVYYMFYDYSITHGLDILVDPDYDESLKKCVINYVAT